MKTLINNCKPVNCGIVVNNIEILSHNFHNPYCDIVATYNIIQDGNKIEVTCCKDLKNNSYSCEIYRFKDKNESQHYYSRHYQENEIPKKYKDIFNSLKETHEKINFEDYTHRN